VTRRKFLQVTTGASVAAMTATFPIWAGEPEDTRILVPADKRLDPDWLGNLFLRGEPEIFRGDQLHYIGMPVGGLCAGLLYLGGDGKPWLWDIFNRNSMEKSVTYRGRTFGNRDGSTYVEPLVPRSPLSHGFAVKYTAGGQSAQRTLDKDGGWTELTFQGNYPLATVSYADPACPLAIKLEAFSPFVPLSFDDSSYPASIMRYIVTNSGSAPAKIEFAGWLENVVLSTSSPRDTVVRENQSFKDENGQGVILSADIANPSSATSPHLSLTHELAHAVPVKQRHDFGTMAIYLIDTDAGISSSSVLPDGNPAEQVFAAVTTTAPRDRPIAALKKVFTLAPGESSTLSFVISWHFANIDPRINGLGVIHAYAARFPNAGAVARHIAADFERLKKDTFDWVQTWHDSTLPHWFLNRSFNNICNLATTTSYRFANGQFWAWEGVYCCEGTCTHVWGYAQAMARIFPELERALREKTDYGFALNLKTGTINFRGTHAGFAADGQAGIILRTYREHLMTVDDSFLKPLWSRVRLAMDRLISQVNDKGLLDGPQHNTLDTAWFGEISWISGLYLAALRAAEEMAKVTGDSEYAGKCRSLFAKGSQSLVPELFDGEYFANKIDPRHLDAINSGSGCEVDQLMGQSWSWQVGLGRIFPREKSISALKALYRYNFAPDAGHYHEQMKVGRWYAMPGEAGLLVCTFPRTDWDFKKASGKGPAWAASYFNECQSGYEHEAASNMIAEELVQEGLAVTRAIHDRYAPEKRNPFNEIECGDHYSRAMASYGSFITLCGFEYDGPQGRIGFAPRLTPDDFKAAFTSARGWGTFSQQSDGSTFTASISLKWGELPLKMLSVKPSGTAFNRAAAQLDGQVVPARLVPADEGFNISFAEQLTIAKAQTLRITLSRQTV
jgi:non-lysosomal glucosylceramidase